MEMPKVKVANFEGPFDLLLHLIKKNEMDIYNVEIYKITSQYLKYLDDMKIMDLEITSEFIVVAATLIEIKSKKLLPNIKVSEENEEDIEKNLMEKLIEYKKIKGAALFFKEKYINSGDIYTKKPEIIEEIKSDKKEEDIFKKNVIQRKIYIDKYKIEDKMDELLRNIEEERIVKFRDIIRESECKLEAVVTFLALLELIKLRMIKAYQNDNFDDILIERRKIGE